MAEIAYNDIWRSDFYNNVSAKDALQDINLYHLIEANKIKCHRANYVK